MGGDWVCGRALRLGCVSGVGVWGRVPAWAMALTPLVQVMETGRDNMRSTSYITVPRRIWGSVRVVLAPVGGFAEDRGRFGVSVGCWGVDVGVGRFGC